MDPKHEPPTDPEPVQLTEDELEQLAGGVIESASVKSTNVKWEGPDLDASVNFTVKQK